MPLAQDCLAPVTDSSTGHYNNAGTDSSSLWLIFLASIQQGRAIERVYEALRVCNVAPTKNIPKATEVGTPFYSEYFRWHQRCSHYSSTV